MRFIQSTKRDQLSNCEDCNKLLIKDDLAYELVFNRGVEVLLCPACAEKISSGVKE